MALTIGELVGFIRADGSDFERGLARSQLRMEGFRLDVNGRLRDVSGRFVDESQVMGRALADGFSDAERAGTRIVTVYNSVADAQSRTLRARFQRILSASRGLADGVRAHAGMAASALKRIGMVLAGIGVGVPAVAAVTTAVMGLAAGAAAAGIAVKAFSLAAQPQLDMMKESAAAADKLAKAQEDEARKKALADKLKAQGSDLAEKAEKAYTTARLATKDAEAAYQRQTKGMPKATAEAALAQAKLKAAHEEWSASLSSTTMPVFTKGLNILRGLLPTLTPFVKAAATAFSGFLDEVAAGVKSAGFKEWAADMAQAAGPALSNFLKTIKNLAVGFGGLLQAFLPVSGQMTGGLASMSQAFANWATSLKDSEGFAVFVDLAREGGQTLGVLASAALELLSALSPLIGVTAQLAVWLAEIIQAMPPDVLLAIGTAWAAISLVVKAYAVYGAIAASVTRAWAIAQGIWNSIMMANPIGLVIGLIVGLIAVIVIAYQKSETFREIVQTVWEAVKTAVTASVTGIMVAIAWFAGLPGKISGWFGQAKDWAIRKFTELVTWVSGLPGRASSALSALPGALRRRAAEAGASLVSATKQKLTDAVNWIKGLPGRAKAALGSIGSVLWNAGKSLVTGFIDGIVSMFSSVKSTLGDLTSKLTSWKGPEDVDKKLLTPAGRMVIAGFQRGIDLQAPALRAQLQGLTGEVPGMALGGLGGGQAAGRGGVGGGVLRIEFAGPEEVTRLIRGIVMNKGGGNVQLALGR